MDRLTYDQNLATWSDSVARSSRAEDREGPSSTALISMKIYTCHCVGTFELFEGPVGLMIWLEIWTGIGNRDSINALRLRFFVILFFVYR